MQPMETNHHRPGNVRHRPVRVRHRHGVRRYVVVMTTGRKRVALPGYSEGRSRWKSVARWN